MANPSGAVRRCLRAKASTTAGRPGPPPLFRGPSPPTWLGALPGKGRGAVTGYVLPIARDTANTQWQSGAWFLRRERCYLSPGDSPMGMRLPLDSLPWAAPEDRPQLHAPDPNQAFAKLPAYSKIHSRLGRSKTDLPDEKASRAPGAHESAYWIARTAICAEPRHGVLYIFLPPSGGLG